MSKATFAVIVLGTAVSANAATYVQLAPFSPTIASTSGSTTFVSSVVDGTTAYSMVGGTSNKGITKVTGLGGTPSSSLITSNTAVNTATGVTTAPAGIIRNYDSSSVIFPDSGTDAVYKVDKTTGAITQYVSKANLLLSAANINLLTNARLSNGELALYDSTNTRFIKTVSGGTGASIATVAAVDGATGLTNSVSGFVAGPSDVLFIGDGTNDRIVKYDPSTNTGSVVLNAAQITGVTGGAGVNFLGSSFLYAPDGKIYFLENNSSSARSLMSFDPANPSGTLSVVLNNADFIAGPAGTSAIFNTVWYQGNIGFTVISGTGAGLYAIPEPATLGLIAMSGIGLLRRRRA